MIDRLEWFRDARLGLFCHYGVYSVLGRGEWAMNREAISPRDYAETAKQFTAKRFDADVLTGLARDLGAKYVVFTTKHHDGFCLYDSALTDYTAVKQGPRRDLVAEVVASCRRRGLKIGLYHTLNDWHTSPDATDALEDYMGHGKGGETYQRYIAYVHGGIREIMSNYGKIDIMWYDGWWPFDADGWQARKLDAMVRRLQPGIICNNRNCLRGDFGTPEQHATADGAQRLFEACFTLNDNWGFAAGDHNWKSPRAVADLLIHCAKHGGNLLINVGPRGDGTIPAASVRILREVGRWVKANEESLRPGLTGKPDMDWTHFCGDRWTERRGVVYMHVTNWPAGGRMVLNGVSGRITGVRIVATGRRLAFRQTGGTGRGRGTGGRLEILGLPRKAPDSLATVVALEHEGRLSSYMTGGMRVPQVKHCKYDPVK